MFIELAIKIGCFSQTSLANFWTQSKNFYYIFKVFLLLRLKILTSSNFQLVNWTCHILKLASSHCSNLKLKFWVEALLFYTYILILYLTLALLFQVSYQASHVWLLLKFWLQIILCFPTDVAKVIISKYLILTHSLLRWFLGIFGYKKIYECKQNYFSFLDSQRGSRVSLDSVLQNCTD